MSEAKAEPYSDEELDKFRRCYPYNPELIRQEPHWLATVDALKGELARVRVELEAERTAAYERGVAKGAAERNILQADLSAANALAQELREKNAQLMAMRAAAMNAANQSGDLGRIFDEVVAAIVAPPSPDAGPRRPFPKCKHGQLLPCPACEQPSAAPIASHEVRSRSVQRREALQRGEPMPEFLSPGLVPSVSAAPIAEGTGDSFDAVEATFREHVSAAVTQQASGTAAHSVGPAPAPAGGPEEPALFTDTHCYSPACDDDPTMCQCPCAGCHPPDVKAPTEAKGRHDTSR